MRCWSSSLIDAAGPRKCMGLEWGWICLWRGWGSVFPSKLLSTLFSKKVCLQDQEAKRHCEAASLRCAEHVPGCWLTSSPRIHGIKVRKDLQESPSTTIPPAQPRPPLKHVPRCCSPEISWAPSALLRRRRNIFWRNVFTDSGEEKKWGVYPTSPVWCPHTEHAFFSPTAVAIPHVLLWQNSTFRTFCPLPNLWSCP